MSNTEKIAKEFWTTQKEYPKYGTIKQRRLYELNYLVPKLQEVNSLLDLGCGDGSTIRCLKELTDIQIFYAYDIAENLMSNIPAITRVYDCYNPSTLPKVDFTIFAGVLPFIFDDNKIIEVLSYISSDVLYIRVPCSLEEENILVNSYSEKLQANYSSLYRTKDNVLKIISTLFLVEDVRRAYPDSIESEFGTKQFMFYCVKK